MIPSVINAYTLRHLTMCDRRIWLDQFGDSLLREDRISIQSTQGVRHEQAISAIMFGPAATIPAASWEAMLQSSRRLMQQGVAGLQGAAFECALPLGRPLIARGRVDWLKRTAQPSRLGRWSYEPIEIKLRQEPNEADRLQLDLYLWLLNDFQGVEPSGWFWLGKDADNQPKQVIEHSFRPERLFSAFERIDTILNRQSAPAIFLAAHCETCHWHKNCKTIASAGRDLSALPGLPRQTWEHMRLVGIHTLDQVLTLSPRDLERFKGLGKAKAYEVYTYAQAVGKGQPIQRSLLPSVVRQPGLMLDLETCMAGAVGVPWCFGWQDRAEQFHVAIVDRYYEGDPLHLLDSVDVTTVSDSDEGWRMVARAALDNPGPIYHWGSFEKGVLRTTAPAEVVNALDDRLHDLNKTFKRTFAFPVRGTSIKAVAPYLGFAWPEGTSAFSAWADYQAWLLDGNKAALARACAYNRADVKAMALVWRWMLAHDQDAHDLSREV